MVEKYFRIWIQTILAKKHWIGMRDEVTEDLWTHFPSETPMTFLDWVTSDNPQPNGGSKANCGAYWEIYDYHMVDEDCTRNFTPICEKP